MTILGLTSAACVQVDGGAVEFSWLIRDFDGSAAGCNLKSDANNSALDDDIAEVRICWEAAPDGSDLAQVCSAGFSDAFPCGEFHGVTGFEIEQGRTAIWVEPVCDSGQSPPADRFEVPAPIVRDIDDGAVATLNALLIVVAPDACAP